MERRQGAAAGSDAPATPSKPQGLGQLRISPGETDLLAPEQQPSPLGDERQPGTLRQQPAAGQAGGEPPRNLFPLVPIALTFLPSLQPGLAASTEAQGQPPPPPQQQQPQPRGAANGHGSDSGLAGSFGSLLSIAADEVCTRSVPFSPDP